MLKKLLLVTTMVALTINLTACRQTETPVEDETPIEVDYFPEEIPQTPEQIRANFETFFDSNRTRIINQAATDGEEIRLELGTGNEFIMTIVLDDVELTDDNRALYSLAFGLSFSDMDAFFEGLATEIMTDADITNFRLTVAFADMTGEEIARSRFDVVAEIQ